MSVHVLGGWDDAPQILVTQTDDVAKARALVLADVDAREALHDNFTDDLDLDEDAGSDVVLAAALSTLTPRVEYGRTIPDVWREYAWVWRGWPAEGRERAHGETTAVRFLLADDRPAG